MYNCNTDSLGLILGVGVEVFCSEGHCSGALCHIFFYYYIVLSHFPISTHKLNVNVYHHVIKRAECAMHNAH